MKLLTVNVSYPMEVTHGRKTVSTGIFKEPVPDEACCERLTSTATGRRTL